MTTWTKIIYTVSTRIIGDEVSQFTNSVPRTVVCSGFSLQPSSHEANGFMDSSSLILGIVAGTSSIITTKSLLEHLLSLHEF